MTSNVEDKTILYVDDDELSALLIDRVLRIRGYKIVHKATSLEGLEAAERVDPHIILININLPDLNRRVITSRLRNNEKLADVPVIALVSFRGEEAREMSEAFGCDGHITKPIDTERLPGQIGRFLNRPPRSSSPSGENAYLPAYNAQLALKLESRVRELTEANQALLDLNRQQADLFNAISSELKMTLHPIKERMARLSKGSYGELKQEQRQALETISRHTDLLGYFMAELDYLRRFESNEILVRPLVFDFNKLLNEIITIIEALFEQSAVHFERNIDNHLPKMYADRDGIKGVVLHLLNDALKSAQQGVVTLTATTKSNSIQVSISNAGSSDDEAITMFRLADHKLERDGSFEPGFFISKHIVEANKGQIWASSVQGRGTTYTFTLPFREIALTEADALAA